MNGFSGSDMAPYRERTDEFVSILKHVKNRLITNTMQQQQQRAQPVERNKSTCTGPFGVVSRQIDADIRSVREKLTKLEILCKKSSLFDDRSNEIDALVCLIKQDTAGINTEIAHLRDKLTHHRSTKYNNEAVKAYHQSIVVALQSQLAEISNNFKSILEFRSDKLRQTANNLEQFGNSESLFHRKIHPHATDSILSRDEQIEMCGTLHPPPARQQIQKTTIIDTEHMSERVDEMRHIERTIIDLGQVFEQLAVMVKEQDELVQRIDHNMDQVSFNVEAAHVQLKQFWNSVSSNRWLMVKLFAVLVIFLVLFVIFFV